MKLKTGNNREKPTKPKADSLKISIKSIRLFLKKDVLVRVLLFRLYFFPPFKLPGP